ncbi:MAG: HEPN domain-containing protein [Ignavibacteriales bacterium]|nr:HEPN domain-containing protein [Ignavibacteriales bacterium]MCF8317054.1 HEPN domain-containing protein [Ignavibacteriales bacterium]
MPESVTYWIDLSEYDICTAEAMLETKRFLYVGFMAHQAIEKILKAYFANIHKETPPYSHSLSYIAKKAGIYEHFSEEQKYFLDMLEPLNIECRYPLHKAELLKILTEEKCREILKKSKTLQKWIREKL